MSDVKPTGILRGVGVAERRVLLLNADGVFRRVLTLEDVVRCILRWCTYGHWKLGSISKAADGA